MNINKAILNPHTCISHANKKRKNEVNWGSRQPCSIICYDVCKAQHTLGNMLLPVATSTVTLIL